ncbi:acetyltransferase [Tessaracoccus sp. Z1128]
MAGRLGLYGAGGHAKVVAEIAELLGYDIAHFVDDTPKQPSLWGYDVVAAPADDVAYVVAIGHNNTRRRIAETLPRSVAALVHPGACVSSRAEIGEGSVAMAGAIVNPATAIGRHCIINTGASVDHDCVVGDFAHISPGVVLSGGVMVGEGTHIGSGASIIPGVRIGAWSAIGAGAVIIRDVPDGVTVVGNPGRELQR